MTGQNMQPSLLQNPYVLGSLAGTTNQPASSKAPPDPSRFNCSKCRYSTRDSEAFERHWAQHAGVTFTCLICGHISYTKVESQRHNVQHSGKFPFRCGFCSYGAVRRDYVAKHIQRVHSKFLRNSQSQNVVLMGDVAVAQPVNVVPNLIPFAVNQPQGTNPAPTNYHFGGELSKSVGTMPNQYQNNSSIPRVRVTAPTGTLATNHPTIKVTNNSFAPVNQTKYGGHNVLAGLNQPATSTASGVMGTGSKQSAHIGTANVSNRANHPERRAPPNILRKPQQRPAVSAPSTVYNGFPPGRQPVNITGQVVARLHHPTGVASNTLSVVPGLAMNSSIAGSAVLLNPSSFQARPNVSLTTHQGSVGMASKSLYAYNQPTAVPSSRVPSTGGQAFRGSSNVNLKRGLVSVNPPSYRPTNGSSPNQPEKRVSFATGNGYVNNVTNRFPNTVGNSLNTQSRVTESQMGSNPTLTSLLANGLSGKLGNSLSHKTIDKGLCAPVQVELLEPLHQQPIHEQTLTVSYPEQMNIRPGSLVELVNVNMVNGAAQELQLRVLSEQSLGSSEKNAQHPTPAVGTAFKDGFTMGQGLSRDKRQITTQACPRTIPGPGQAFPVSNFALPQISCVPTTMINTRSETSVAVKEEPSEYASGLTLLQDQNKLHHSPVAPESQPTGLPNIGITIRKVENTYSSTSFAVSRLHDRASATSSPQSPDGSMNVCKASATPVLPNAKSDIRMERETLPVISSVYSLGDKAPCEGPPVERRLFTGNSAMSHGTMSTFAEDHGNALLVPCTPSEELIRLFEKEEASVEPPAQNRTVHSIGGKANQLLQASTVQAQTKVSSRLNTVHHDSLGSPSTPKLKLNIHRPAEAHPPPLQLQSCRSSIDLDAKERTICGVRISGFSPHSYKQLFTMVPRVCLVRISEDNPSTHCHNSLKLRLKRKRCETEDDSPDIFEALALPMAEATVEPFGVSDRSERKDSKTGKRRKLSGSVDCCRLYLTPAKEDQPVRWPGPNQPVVVLNHPHPHVLRWGGERSPQSPSDGRGVAPLRIVVFRDSHKVVTEIVKSPSLKMTFKKVDGEQYQVTELLAEGISSSVDL